MAIPLQYPLINGVKHDFASIELNINGQIFIGFKAINYSRERTRTKVRGNSPDPIAKTTGTNEYNAEVELYLAEWNYLQKAILIPAAQQAGLGSGYGDLMFNITVSYSDPGFDPIQDIILACSIDSTDASQSQGPDPLIRKLKLEPLKILFNGIDDLANPLISPPT
jgi:hypothetical protein